MNNINHNELFQPEKTINNMQYKNKQNTKGIRSSVAWQTTQEAWGLYQVVYNDFHTTS